MAPTLLIDVDGTISDSLGGIQSSFRAAMAAIDHPVPDDAFMSTLAGPPMRDSLRRAGLRGPLLDDAFAAYTAAQVGGGWSDTSMFAGWPELLDGWRADGIRLATATSKGGHFARKVLARFGILDRFDFIGAADDGGTRREKDAVVEHTLRVLGLPAQRVARTPSLDDGTTSTDRPATSGGDHGPSRRHDAVLIGDRIHDIDGAHAFGLPCILVGWGYGPDDERRAADAVAATPAELDRTARALLAGPAGSR